MARSWFSSKSEQIAVVEDSGWIMTRLWFAEVQIIGVLRGWAHDHR